MLFLIILLHGKEIKMFLIILLHVVTTMPKYYSLSYFAEYNYGANTQHFIRRRYNNATEFLMTHHFITRGFDSAIARGYNTSLSYH